MLPTLVVGDGCFVWSSSLLPNRYRSQTTILVVPQRVPESYVGSTVTAGVGERLQTISQQILSRTRLEQIIEEFNLYQDERQTMIMEDIVARMRVRDVKLDVASRGRRYDDASSFTVSFESVDPRIAMLVAERLASMFVQENLQDREVLADSTNQFLQAQLEDARRRLIEHEKKLEEFRRRNAGPAAVADAVEPADDADDADAASRPTPTRTNRDRDRARDARAVNCRDPGSGADRAAGGASRRRPTEPAARRGAATGGRARQFRNLELRLTPSIRTSAVPSGLIAELERQGRTEAQVSPSADGVAATLPRESASRVAAHALRRQEEIRRPARHAQAG